MPALEETTVGRWTATILRDSPFWVDGGTLFGMVPRSRWARKLPPDRDNLVPVALNSLLLRNGERTLLIDTGIGNRYSKKMETLYKLDRKQSLMDELAQAGVHREEIDTVILTHLHLDHTGWCVHFDSKKKRLVPTFPKATYYVQNSEYAAAHATNELTRGSYMLEDFEPLKKAGVLKRIRGKRMIAEGVELMLTGAHSPGHMVVCIKDGGAGLLCPGEILPDRHHMRLAWTMAYDAVPGMVVEVKRTLLSAAEREGMTVFLSHEMENAFGRIRLLSQGDEFRWEPL